MSALRVVEFSQVPPYLRIPYIFAGYRSNDCSAKACLRSLFRIHNETGNVWSHLLGGLVFGWDLISSFSGERFGMGDMVIITFQITAILCLLSSSAYHLFACYGKEEAHSHLLCMDVMGISLLIWSSYIGGLYFGFECFPLLQVCYCVTLSTCVLAAVLFASLPTSSPLLRFRVPVLVGIVLFSFLPITHWAYLAHTYGQSPGHAQADLALFLPRVLGMLALYGLGFFFYQARLPERAFPGAFDIWVHSHQIWHALCFMAAWLWETTLRDARHVSRSRGPLLCS